jgi:hypothetical protein
MKKAGWATRGTKITKGKEDEFLFLFCILLCRLCLLWLKLFPPGTTPARRRSVRRRGRFRSGGPGGRLGKLARFEGERRGVSPTCFARAAKRRLVGLTPRRSPGGCLLFVNPTPQRLQFAEFPIRQHVVDCQFHRSLPILPDFFTQASASLDYCVAARTGRQGSDVEATSSRHQTDTDCQRTAKNQP